MLYALLRCVFSNHYASLFNIFASLLFVNGWSPYWINSIIKVEWSISVEMTFYLFLPLLFSKIKNLSHAILFFVITLIIYQINTILHNMPLIPESETWEIFLFLWFPTQLSAFSFGIMLFFLLDNRISSGRSNISWLIVLFSFVLLYFAIYAGMLASIRRTFSPTDQRRRGVMFTISTVELVLALVPAIVPAPPPELEGCPVEMGATPLHPPAPRPGRRAFRHRPAPAGGPVGWHSSEDCCL